MTAADPRRRRPPPITVVGPIAWLRQNLFSSWVNGLVTVVLGRRLSAGWCSRSAQWALTEARWGVVTTNLRLFLIGQYPADQAWRVWLALADRSRCWRALSAGVYGQCHASPGHHAAARSSSSSRRW